MWKLLRNLRYVADKLAYCWKLFLVQVLAVILISVMIPINSVLALHRDYAETFSIFEMSELGDIYKALEEWQHHYMSTSWELFGKHLERVQNYLDKSDLAIDKKHAVAHSLDLQRGVYLTGIEWPERRLYINEQDRRDLTDCRTYLRRKFSFGNEIYTLSCDEVKKLSVQEQCAIKTIEEITYRIELLDIKLREPTHILNASSDAGKRLTAFAEKALLRRSTDKESGTKALQVNSAARRKVKEKSLADLCIPGRGLKVGSPEYEEAQLAVAESIKLVWDSLPLETSFSQSTKTYEQDLRASAVAVFKLMQWIGKVKRVGPATWADILGPEWGLEISVGIAKYTIDKNHTTHFVEVVKSALTIVKAKFPAWLRNTQPLPEEYQ